MNCFSPLNQVKLKGSVAEHMERFFHERIRSEEAHDVVYAAAEDSILIDIIANLDTNSDGTYNV